jgi:hypothetical protein
MFGKGHGAFLDLFPEIKIYLCGKKYEHFVWRSENFLLEVRMLEV